MHHAPFEITIPLSEPGRRAPGRLLVQRDIVGGAQGDKGLFLEMTDAAGNVASGFLSEETARRLAGHIVAHLDGTP